MLNSSIYIHVIYTLNTIQAIQVAFVLKLPLLKWHFVHAMEAKEEVINSKKCGKKSNRSAQNLGHLSAKIAANGFSRTRRI